MCVYAGEKNKPKEMILPAQRKNKHAQNTVTLVITMLNRLKVVFHYD